MEHAKAAQLSSNTLRGIEAERLALARELLDDTELSRLAPEQLLLKASRLARLIDATDVLKWLEYELRGYYDNVEHLAFGARVGRVINKAQKLGHWAPLASIAAQAQAMQIQIQATDTKCDLCAFQCKPERICYRISGRACRHTGGTCPNGLGPLADAHDVFGSIP